MEADNLPIFGNNIDKSQVQPIHQKRILAFVNHFIVNTVTFLNDFVVNCEMKFIDFERKLNRIESSLLIVEGKLSSINGLDDPPKTEAIKVESPKGNESQPQDDKLLENNNNLNVDKSDINSQNESTDSECMQSIKENVVRASDDVRYRKYFKMIQFGVPSSAVKIKMAAEGVDPDILDSPNKILEDGIAREIVEDES